MAVRKLGAGRWEASYRDPQRRERIKTFRTRAEADRWLATVKTDLARGDYVDPRLARSRFSEWADEWLATTAHLKPKTRVGYESDLRVHVLPTFADRAVGSIQQVDVRRFVADMVANGAAPGTVRNARKVLRLVLNTAEGSGAIRSNPCNGVRVPASPKLEMVFLSAEEIEALATAIDPRYASLVRLAAYTGLRRARSAPCASGASTSCGAGFWSPSRSPKSRGTAWCSVSRRPTSVVPSLCRRSYAMTSELISPAGRAIPVTSCSRQRAGVCFATRCSTSECSSQPSSTPVSRRPCDSMTCGIPARRYASPSGLTPRRSRSASGTHRSRSRSTATFTLRRVRRPSPTRRGRHPADQALRRDPGCPP